MPQMGCRRFRRGFCTDETVRGQPYSRRYSKACLQDSADETRDVRVVGICSAAFCARLVAGAEIGLILDRRSLGEGGLAHVKSAVYVEHLAGDVGGHGRSEEECGVNNFAYIAKAT